ncbi:hypothetical protein KKB41_02320 [Patescibacteria group bacterium]|nr:hypothetical protein [Patescibacteria group bacterium]
MKDLIKSITKKEWKFWIWVVAGLILATSLSRLAVPIFMPEDGAWRGNVIYSFIDRYVYVSYIEQAREGNILFQDLYTAKEESSPMLNVFWLGMGLVAKATRLSANAALEIFRILLIPALFFVSYLLISFFIKDIWQRKLAFLFSAFAGGLGALFFPIIALFYSEKAAAYQLPIDFDTPEAFLFPTSYYSPHFIFSTTLLLLIILLSLLAIEKKNLHYAFPAGIAGLILSNFHPFSFIVVSYLFICYFLFLLWKNRAEAWFLFKYGCLLFIFVLPSIIYHAFMFFTPWWQNQTWGSTTYIPNIFSILSGYGLLVPFAIWSLWLAYKNKIEIKKIYFLLIWFLGQIVLIFLPVSVQRRFLEGYSFVLIILASYAIVLFLEKRKWIIKGKIFAITIFILCFGLSYILVLTLDLKNIVSQGNVVYFKKAEVEAIKELKNIVPKDELIISDIYNSAIIPGIALRRVFVGHGTETIDFERKYLILERFMASSNDMEKSLILDNNGIKYLFYDNIWEKDWAWDPDEMDFLEKVYEQGDYKIYKVL